ncbi:hypothetical protein BDP27DRAFT_1313499 [Rhodocollybia butyracea]|uniref:Pentatricopeptide repeat-containing protein n=1 Tax=Rhodocollybia butyracea TaxID=206335 RepID=A0A9P5UFP0_9AGAR|nr:hypothetical protein BDP27DRAFT_1313499 [Rhodocollybia butyracea]
MLRASSLGLSSTYRILLEQWPHKYQAALIQRRKTPHLRTATRLSNESEHENNVDTSTSIDQTLKTEEKNVESHDEIFTQELYVRQKLPYITGKSGYSPPLPPLYGGKFKRGSSYKKRDALSTPVVYPDIDTDGDHEDHAVQILNAEASSNADISNEDLYYHLCHVIANTNTVEDAWTAYSTILTIPSPPRRSPYDPPIPFEHLHRLCRLFSQNLPRTRTQFLRMLSVFYTIRKHGGTIHQFEWNSLIANAGNGWRGSKSKDFKLALEIFEDMVSGSSPGTAFSPSDYPALPTPQPVEPDIYTYNTLIGIASKTLYGKAIARASAMLRSSGHPPDRITHLSLLVFFTHTHQLMGVRSTLAKMREQNLEIGLDGLNACIWAYGRHGKLDWAESIYRVLRHNVHPEPDEAIKPLIEQLNEEDIYVSPLMRPNAITFSTLIQLMAWNGHLTATYNILMDMLSSLNMEPGAPLVRGDDDKLHYTNYTALYTSFRSLFIGFSRHGIYLRNDFTARLQERRWTTKQLQNIFDMYIGLPEPIKPSVSMIYCIMVAFDRTSEHNVELLREVWNRLEDQFQGPWGGPRHRLRVLREILFSSRAEAHLQMYGFRTPKSEPHGPFTNKYS